MLCAEQTSCMQQMSHRVYMVSAEYNQGSMKISRRNPCSPFFSVSYSINRHKILQYLFSIIVVIQYYTASWVGQGLAQTKHRPLHSPTHYLRCDSCSVSVGVGTPLIARLGLAVRVSASYSIVIALRLLIFMCPYNYAVQCAQISCSLKYHIDYLYSKCRNNLSTNFFFLLFNITSLTTELKIVRLFNRGCKQGVFQCCTVVKLYDSREMKLFLKKHTTIWFGLIFSGMGRNFYASFSQHIERTYGIILT